MNTTPLTLVEPTCGFCIRDWASRSRRWCASLACYKAALCAACRGYFLCERAKYPGVWLLCIALSTKKDLMRRPRSHFSRVPKTHPTACTYMCSAWLSLACAGGRGGEHRPGRWQEVEKLEVSRIPADLHKVPVGELFDYVAKRMVSWSEEQGWCSPVTAESFAGSTALSLA